MLSTQGKKSKTTRVHIANAMLTDDLLPGHEITFNSCIEVTQYEELVFMWHSSNEMLKLFIKLILNTLISSKSWSISAYECRAGTSV